MPTHRVPRTVCLAVEAARAALANITSPHDLSGGWYHYNWKLMTPPGVTLVELTIRVIGDEPAVKVSCDMSLWDKARTPTRNVDCYVSTGRTADKPLHFRCRLDGNRVYADLQP